MNRGVDHRGLGNSGLGNSGLGNSGLGNSGLGNSGLGNSGLGNSGLCNSGLGNSGLWCSWFAVVAAAIVVAFFGWHWANGQELGSRDDGNAAYLLTTGWIAVLCFLGLTLYAVRRAAHRLRLSPEFRWKAKLSSLERAQSELTELQNRIVRREVSGAVAVRKEAARILRRYDVHRVLTITIEMDPRALGMLRIKAGPRQPLGRLAAWLQAHIWLGVAAALLVWFHGGMRTGSTMGLLLNGLSYAVICSGLLGALLWTFGPTWLTRAERELSVEKAFALDEHYRRKIAEVIATMRASTATDAATGLRRDLRTLTGQQELVQQELRRLGLFRELLRFWRLLHVPCSILLLALVCVHVLGIWHY